MCVQAGLSVVVSLLIWHAVGYIAYKSKTTLPSTVLDFPHSVCVAQTQQSLPSECLSKLTPPKQNLESLFVSLLLSHAATLSFYLGTYQPDLTSSPWDGLCKPQCRARALDDGGDVSERRWSGRKSVVYGRRGNEREGLRESP